MRVKKQSKTVGINQRIDEDPNKLNIFKKNHN